MGRLVGHREWETLYHGWNWADVVADMGFVRDDGKTMTAQPHLDLDPQEDVDAGPHAADGSAAEPERAAQRDERRASGTAFIADYSRQGPAGRPAPTDA